MSHHYKPSGPGTVPVLTINTRGDREVTLYGHRRELGIRTGDDPLGPAAWIVGEDLFALREFLAEMDEEAFVRPADPVSEPDWHRGDIVLFLGCSVTTTYVRGPKGWSRTVHSSVRATTTDVQCIPDSEIDSNVKDPDYRVVRKQGVFL